MNRHATPAERAAMSRIDRLTQAALETGHAALAKFGPEAALVAMQPWSDQIDKVKRKAERRSTNG